MGKDVKDFKAGDLAGRRLHGGFLPGVRLLQGKAWSSIAKKGATFTYNPALTGTTRAPPRAVTLSASLVSDKFVVSIPGNLDAKSAAPLLCAGITLYSPLRHWGVKKGSKVGIVGLGGFGHMGPQDRQGHGRGRDPLHPAPPAKSRKPGAWARIMW